jgi:tight adherence protein B
MEPAVIVAILAAAAVMLLFFGIFGSRRVSPTERIEQVTQAAVQARDNRSPGRKSMRASIFGGRAAAGVDRVVERRDWGADMARELARADLQLRPSEYLALRTAAVIGAPLVTFLIGKTLLPGLDNPLALLVAVILGWWVPRYWLNRRKSKRLQAFNDHLADTITLVANALRAGASFLQAIELVVRETQPPISTEFNRVIREVNLGLPFEQALNNMTAQQRMSGYVVAGLPIALMALLSVISPSFMAPMFQDPPAVMGIPVGVILLFFGGVLMGVGFLAIRRIVDIEV